MNGLGTNIQTVAENFPAIFAAMAALSLAPLLAVTVTSFTKITLVILIIRNALGIQQMPPNNVVYAISIILTFYIMSPVLTEVYAALSREWPSVQAGNIERAADIAVQPIKAFLLRYVDPASQQLFADTLKKVWPHTTTVIKPTDMSVLVPAFLERELTRAFQIGFLLYLPFLVLDIGISALLIALGMQSMSPTVISTPFKLLLFVAVDGWARLFHGLVLSYVP